MKPCWSRSCAQRQMRSVDEQRSGACVFLFRAEAQEWELRLTVTTKQRQQCCILFSEHIPSHSFDFQFENKDEPDGFLTPGSLLLILSLSLRQDISSYKEAYAQGNCSSESCKGVPLILESVAN